MKVVQFARRMKAFTLIELLIVVAIIAILAAIAVPNFLEAQIRSKVSRTLADTRTMKTGLESYYVDNNQYPETDLGLDGLFNEGHLSVYRLTTPISYLTSLPASPWKENYGTGGQPKLASAAVSYLYVRKRGIPGYTTNDASGFDVNYKEDRRFYTGPFTSLVAQNEGISKGEWLIKSVGPDNIDDRDTANPKNSGHTARIYDPTNGTVSRGDLVIFNDVGGSLK